MISRATTIASAQWKVFAANFLAIFILVILQHLPFNFAHPLISPQTQVDPLISIKTQLEKIPNNFHLTHASIIKKVEASAEYDNANGYVVVDLNSGKVIAEKNLSEKTPIASLTKIMTAIVASDLSQNDELFTVSKKATEVVPTKIGVIEGQKWTRNELLHALLLTSSNDAAEVLREGIDSKIGSGVFVKAMNEKAKFLGLKNTSFENPQGFDNKYQYSSPEDLAILTQYALQNYPDIKGIVAKDYQFFPENENHKQADLYNWNGLLGVYPGVSGVKIGNTDDARYTTIVTSNRGGHLLMVVLLGAPGVLQRDLWASQLLDLGFESYGLAPVSVTEAELKTKYSSWKYFN